MAFSGIRSHAASALPVMGIALALANWNATPAAAWAWAVAIVMFLVMAAVRQGFQIACRNSSQVAQYMKRRLATSAHPHANGGDDPDSGFRQDADVVKAGLERTVATVNNGVVFGALMMIIPLATTAGHVEAASRCPHPGVSPARGLDLGALRPGLPDRLARAADQDGRARVDGARWWRYDPHRCPSSPPRSPDAAARSGLELVIHHSSRGRRS